MRIPTSKQDKGFTLIELLVVVVIIGILAAVAIPVFLNQREKAAESNVKSDLKNAATVYETYFVDNQTYVGVPDAELLESDKVTITVAAGANALQYCLNGTHADYTIPWHYDSDGGGLASGACS